MAIAAQLPITTSRQSRMFLEITTLLLFLNASNVWFWAADIQFSGDSTKPGWFVIQYLSLFVFGTCAILFVVERHRLLIPDLVLFAIGALLIVSTFANSNDYLEISAPVRTVLFIMAGIYVRNSNPELFLARTGFYMALFLFLSVAASLAGYGLMSGIHDGLWRGVFEHKNRFGHFAGLSVFFVVYLLNTKRIGHGSLHSCWHWQR